MSFHLNLIPNFDEDEWVKQVRRTLDEELEEIEIPVTIYGVPKALMLCNPDCYVPHQVAIGPYHHFRPELYDMERYKLAAAKRNQRELGNVKFQDIVNHLIKFELRIRESYQRPLSLGAEALAWMIAVDVCFLFEFFQICGVKKGKVLAKTPSRMNYLVGLSRNKSANNAIFRDIVMLENQIPLFVMRMLLEFQFSSLDFADEILLDMLMEISDELSPFKPVEGSRKIEVKEFAHILDFLYHFIVPKEEIKASEIIEIYHEEDAEKNEDEDKKDSASEPGYLRQLLDEVWRILSRLTAGPLELIKRVIFSKPLKVIVKLPWTIVSKIPVIRIIKEPLENIFGAYREHKDKKDEEESSPDSNNIKPPLREEIAIPSVSQLVNVGVQFLPISEGITSIKFDKKTLTFYIPTMELDVNSEVVLRNLIAYEACTATGPLVLTRYTEMMNGIIDTDADAKILCQRGIIINRLKSEKEVAELWNGMSKSIRLTKVPTLDKVIGDVNKFYSGRWKVKIEKFMNEYVFGSWRILTFLAAIALLALMCLQAFCQVYSCSRVLRIKGLEPNEQQ